MHHSQNNRGFTLLELSIVFVITGLVIGGILVGRELIAASNIRAQITQIEKFSTAAQAFKLKYNCVPGDCAEAVSIGLGSPGGPGGNGNGDGKITTSCLNVSWLNTGYQHESLNFWYHLSPAGFIGDSNYAGGAFAGYIGQSQYLSLNVPQTTMPASKFPGTVINPTTFGCATAIGTMLNTNGFHIAGPPSQSIGGPSVYWDPLIAALTAKSMDMKIDDGLPLSGNIVGDNGGTNTQPCQVGQWCHPCNGTFTANNEYGTDTTTHVCRVDFLKAF